MLLLSAFYKGGDLIREIKEFMEDESGFLSLTILGIGVIFLMLGLLVIVMLWMASYTKASDVYEQIGSAMDFAVVSASILNTTGTIDPEENIYQGTELISDEEVFSYFVDAFNKITGGTYQGGEFYVPNLPGNIIVKDFYKVNPGDPIPPPPTKPGLPRLKGELATQPGYVIYVDVPIYKGGLWNIQPARVDMKLYRMLQTSPI